jgi:hypothetical protein
MEGIRWGSWVCFNFPAQGETCIDLSIPTTVISLLPICHPLTFTEAQLAFSSGTPTYQIAKPPGGQSNPPEAGDLPQVLSEIGSRAAITPKRDSDVQGLIPKATRVARFYLEESSQAWNRISRADLSANAPAMAPRGPTPVAKWNGNSSRWQSNA